MHADRDERSTAPVVSLSLGAACVFRFGSTQARNRPWTDTRLESGDLFAFGGPSRLAYHGVPKTIPGTNPAGIGLRPGGSISPCANLAWCSGCRKATWSGGRPASWTGR